MARQDTSTSRGITRFFHGWGTFVIGHRLLCLMAIGLLTFGAGAVVVERLGIDNGLEAFAPADSVELRTLHAFRDTFGYAGTYAILIEGDVFSRPFLEKLEGLHRAIERIEVDVEILVPKSAPNPEADFFDDDEGWGEEEGGSIMDRVVSLINVRQTVSTEGGVAVEALMDPLPDEADLPAIAKKVLADDFLVGQVVGAAGRHAVVVAQPLRIHENDLTTLYAAVRKAVAPFDTPDFDVKITGIPAINAMLNTMVMDDLFTLGALSLVVVFIALFVLFRHPLGVIGPLVVVGVGVVWTMGTMALIGYDLNILSGILPSFLFVVGIGDSIHLLSIYRDERRAGCPNRDAIVKAVAITGPPVLFTSLTTMVGLFSLKFASVQAVAEMGVSGGIGVVYALVLSLVVLPISLTWVKTSRLGVPEEGRDDIIQRLLVWCVGRSDDRIGRRRRAKTFVAAIALAVVSTLGVTSLEVRHNDLSMLADDAEVKQTVTAMDEHISGAATAQLLIDAPGPKGLKDVELLRGLDRLTEHVLAYENLGDGERVVTHAMSLVDVVKETRRAFHGGKASHYSIPETQPEAEQLLFLFENQSPDELSKMTTLDFSRSQMTLRVKWQDATAYTRLIDHIEEGIEEHVGSRAEIEGTGAVYLGHRIVSVLIDDLIKSFGTAFLAITVLMVFLLRDLKLGVVAMVPNLFPIVIVLGFMGLAGIPMDLNNLLIASIALGIAVDDTVHFLHHFRTAHLRTGRCEEALVEARDHAGRAMFATSVILTLGFGAFFAASTAGMRNYGTLTALTVVCAFLVDLIILPAILRAVYRDEETVPEGADTAPAT